MVLARLAPVERGASGRYDLLAVPFDAIGPDPDRTPATAKERAGASAVPRAAHPALARDREVVTAFLPAAHDGDLTTLPRCLGHRRGAPWHPDLRRSGGASGTRPRRGSTGLVLAPAGRLADAPKVTVSSGRITASETNAAPDRLTELGPRRDHPAV